MSFRFRNKRYDQYRKKKIFTTIRPIPDYWRRENGGIHRGKHLLAYLTSRYGSLDDFELVLTGDLQQGYRVEGKKHPRIWVDVNAYQRYGQALDRLVNRLEFSRHFRAIESESKKKTPEAFSKEGVLTILSRSLTHQPSG